MTIWKTKNKVERSSEGRYTTEERESKNTETRGTLMGGQKNGEGFVIK
jgi:hypothetical protein